MTDKPKIIENFIKTIRDIKPAVVAGSNDPSDVACAEKQKRAILTMLANQKQQAITRSDLISRKPPPRRPFRGR